MEEEVKRIVRQRNNSLQHMKDTFVVIEVRDSRPRFLFPGHDGPGLPPESRVVGTPPSRRRHPVDPRKEFVQFNTDLELRTNNRNRLRGSKLWTLSISGLKLVVVELKVCFEVQNMTFELILKTKMSFIKIREVSTTIPARLP